MREYLEEANAETGVLHGIKVCGLCLALLRLRDKLLALLYQILRQQGVDPVLCLQKAAEYSLNMVLLVDEPPLAFHRSFEGYIKRGLVLDVAL